MRRILLIASLLAMLVLAAVPALAQQNDREERREERFEERFEDERFFFDEDGFDEDDFENGSGVGQEVEQDAESGDVDQSFTVTGEGDNSNQCVGIQGVANTGNAQNLTGVVQYGSEADDFDFEDVGSSIEVSPENSTTCDQQVNQAASAFGG